MHSGEAEVKQRQGKMAFYQTREKTQKKVLLLLAHTIDFGLVVSRICETILVRGLSPTVCGLRCGSPSEHLAPYLLHLRKVGSTSTRDLCFAFFQTHYFSLKENGFTAWC